MSAHPSTCHNITDKELGVTFLYFLYFYLYSAQYLHILQDSKHCITHSIVQVQSNSQITDILLTERQRLKDDHISTSLRFFKPTTGDWTRWQRTDSPLFICLYLGLYPRPLYFWAGVLPTRPQWRKTIKK